MSYKFQRLREKIRQAIESGELSGKLPGERALAKRFHVNAKTLSKALTDLAAEGVLDRSIGRGTYVKGSAPDPSSAGRWLVLCDQQDAGSSLVRAIVAQNSDAQVASLSANEPLRPSFLSQFDAVIDLATSTPEALLRDFVVRNLPLVAIGREPRTYSTNCVAIDMALGASRIGRDLLLSGHRRIVAVEPTGETSLRTALRRVADQIAPEAIVDSCCATNTDVRTMIQHGTTAFVCDSAGSAAMVRRELDQLGVDIPGQISLVAASGICDVTEAPCSGYFIDTRKIAETATSLLREASASARPAILWLAGEFVDRGTTTSVGGGTAVPVQEAPAIHMGGVLV